MFPNLAKPITVLLSLLIPILQNNIPGIHNNGLFVSSKRLSVHERANYDEIDKNLFIGNAQAACDPRILHDLRITHILTIDDHPLPRNISMRRNVTVLFIKAGDRSEETLISYFPMTNAFISKGLEVGIVLVHCHHGISRSATIVIAYCMEKYNIGYEKAFQYVRTKRKFILPNPGFEEQLRQYYDMNFKVKKLTIFGKFMMRAKRHKYQIVSAAMVLTCIIIPVAVLI